uniref:Uncharacterized protein n=1 Tax=Phakopsora pachyrhizi TaxID=170000 RepID=A0A0S1MIE1_PHAPC
MKGLSLILLSDLGFKYSLLLLLLPQVMSKFHPKDPTIPTEKSGDYSPTWVSCPKNLSVFLPSEYPVSDYRLSHR